MKRLQFLEILDKPSLLIYPYNENKPYYKAKDNDYWLRHLIEGENKTVFKDPLKIRPKYLENKFEDVTGKPWASELSGRALSLAKDIREKADSIATSLNNPPGSSGFRFRHLSYSSVKKLRDEGNGAFDIYIEPTEEDPAHANLVIINKISPPIILNSAADAKQGHEIYRRLAENFISVCGAEDISAIEALRQ